jgi:hypothetical protein
LAQAFAAHGVGFLRYANWLAMPGLEEMLTRNSGLPD